VYHIFYSLLGASQHYPFHQHTNLLLWENYHFITYVFFFPCLGYNSQINLYEWLVHVKALKCSFFLDCLDYRNIPFGKMTDFVFHETCVWDKISLRKAFLSSDSMTVANTCNGVWNRLLVIFY
jgi:hypothetical protein